LLEERQNGRQPHPLANQELVEQIRRELAEVSRVILGSSTAASPWPPVAETD
jgi:hypothetical protein